MTMTGDSDRRRSLERTGRRSPRDDSYDAIARLVGRIFDSAEIQDWFVDTEDFRFHVIRRPRHDPHSHRWVDLVAVYLEGLERPAETTVP